MHATALPSPPAPQDQHVVLRGVSWADYQRLLEIRGDKAVPRLRYLEGALEIMTPSEPHESIKSDIGCLVETYCLENNIEFSPVGSWTLEDKALERGAEPDECYVFGPRGGRTRPDLAIEVIWTSGSLDKLDIYRGLRVPEVWFWERGQLTVHRLRGESYEPHSRSEALPGLDLALLVRFLGRPSTSQAIREYRAALISEAALAESD